MVSVTIEYVILIPLLFTTVIVFPLVADRMTSEHQESQLSIELQDAADHIASTIQQLYLSVNSDEISSGIVKQDSPVPVTIGSYPYTVEGSLDAGGGSIMIFNATLILDDVGNQATALVVLGNNVGWDGDRTFRSTSKTACIILDKQPDGTINFYFGGS